MRPTTARNSTRPSRMRTITAGRPRRRSRRYIRSAKAVAQEIPTTRPASFQAMKKLARGPSASRTIRGALRRRIARTAIGASRTSSFGVPVTVRLLADEGAPAAWGPLRLGPFLRLPVELDVHALVEEREVAGDRVGLPAWLGVIPDEVAFGLAARLD